MRGEQLRQRASETGLLGSLAGTLLGRQLGQVDLAERAGEA
jgi:hypothetical protein